MRKRGRRIIKRRRRRKRRSRRRRRRKRGRRKKEKGRRRRRSGSRKKEKERKRMRRRWKRRRRRTMKRRWRRKKRKEEEKRVQEEKKQDKKKRKHEERKMEEKKIMEKKKREEEERKREEEKKVEGFIEHSCEYQDKESLSEEDDGIIEMFLSERINFEIIFNNTEEDSITRSNLHDILFAQMIIDDDFLRKKWRKRPDLYHKCIVAPVMTIGMCIQSTAIHNELAGMVEEFIFGRVSDDDKKKFRLLFSIINTDYGYGHEKSYSSKLHQAQCQI
ncbi:hypothetical protein COCNU_02G000870 [Cocos nucifera]|uniref:Uncharacterized protein n=1 Tax=Cocos nucifera TaxID=13894 RepID=A0A8K0HYC5_COCNU|nr:hypothetical protein COCNU_02G000870 [Cocos nucifera]